MSESEIPAGTESVTPIEAFDAPWGKRIELQHVVYEGGLALLRVRIREGRRFTILELDPATARAWGGLMAEWAARNPQD